jgi:hypothetical protein
VFGEPDPELTFKVAETSLIGEDSFTGSLTRDKGEDVGTYRITIGTLSLGENYILDFEGADFTIAAEYAIKTFPNPFTDHISFEVELSYNSDITLEIYDPTGKKIATVFSGKVEPDLHRFDYIPRNSARGLLIYKFTINGHVMKGKIIYI